MTARIFDARVERGCGGADRERAQPRAPALIPLRAARTRIGAEVGDIELESIDVDRTRVETREREPPTSRLRLKREWQAAGSWPFDDSHVVKLPAIRLQCWKLMHGL